MPSTVASVRIAGLILLLAGLANPVSAGYFDESRAFLDACRKVLAGSWKHPEFNCPLDIWPLANVLSSEQTLRAATNERGPGTCFGAGLRELHEKYPTRKEQQLALAEITVSWADRHRDAIPDDVRELVREALTSEFCGSAAGEVTDPHPEAWLEIRAPGLLGVEAQRTVEQRGWIIYERGLWRAPASRWPEAVVDFARISEKIRSTRTFVRGDPLPERVRERFGSGRISIGESGNAINRFEELEYTKFTLDSSITCIYLRQGRSTSAELGEIIGAGDPIGDMMVEGYYCADPSHGDTDAALAGFVNGIGVRGFAEPEMPHEGSQLKRR